MEPQAQDDSQATFSPNISSQEEKIDWSKSARDIFNQVRGMNPWPVAHTLLDGKRFKIYAVEVVNGAGNPGEIIEKNEESFDCSCKPRCFIIKIGSACWKT